MWELAKTGSRDAELTGVKCWKHKHEQIPIYQSLTSLSCMVLVCRFFPPLDMSSCATTSTAKSTFGTEIWIVKMKTWRRGIIILSYLSAQTLVPVLKRIYGIWIWDWTCGLGMGISWIALYGSSSLLLFTSNWISTEAAAVVPAELPNPSNLFCFFLCFPVKALVKNVCYYLIKDLSGKHKALHDLQ